MKRLLFPAVAFLLAMLFARQVGGSPVVGQLQRISCPEPARVQVISLQGFGKVRMGAPLAEAARATNEEFVVAKDKPSAAENCYHVRLPSLPTVLFMVEEGRIVRVETADRGFYTYSGVHVGDSEARVHAVYGERLEVTSRQHQDGGHYLTVRSTDHKYALVMETDGKEVVNIRAGLLPAAEYVEGCS